MARCGVRNNQPGTTLRAAARAALHAIAGAASARWAKPTAVGWLTLDAWPGGFPDTHAFNAASRAELLTLAAVLADTVAEGEGEKRWLNNEKARVTEAYVAAADTLADWQAVLELAHAKPGDETHRAFWTTWVAEQLRSARRFPKKASEVFPLTASDVMGNALPELTFALTFDDGPTRAGGNTDRTIATLRELGLPATFFVHGKRFGTRKDVKSLYAGFCVSSHGRRHLPHLATNLSMLSVTITRWQLAGAVDHPRIDLFRPPYGQRGGGFAQKLHRSGVRTVMWNIDARDWRGDAHAANVAGRVLALMLVRRKGVILFHDTHAAARGAMPLILRALGATPVQWARSDAL
jgi:peptidoglycan/xylan/chitin deacetylase (PgdA/CDA1 family)